MLNSVFTTINDTDGDGGPAESGGEWSIAGAATVTEGEPIAFTIYLSGNLQSGESTTVQLSVADVETTGGDYSNVTASVNAAVAAYNVDPTNPGTLSWDGTFLTFVSDGTGPMNDLDVTFSSIDDLMVEGDERLNLILSNAFSSTGLSPTLSPTASVVSATIVDNDVPDWAIAGPVMTAEGSTADYTVSLSGVFQAGEIVSVVIGLTDVDTTGGDYGSWTAAVTAAAAANSDVTFDPITGELTYTAPADGAMMADLIIQLPIISDGISEGPEDFVLTLSDPASVTGLSPVVDPAGEIVTTTINGSPVTNPDDYFTNVDTPYVGNVLSNDSDPDGDALTVTEVDGQPIGNPIVTDCGTVVMNPNGSFVFTPFPGFSGVDTFQYTVVDSSGNEETETVTIIVNEAAIGAAKSVSDAVANGDNWDLAFTIVVQNLGNVSLNNLSVLDNVTAKFGTALVAVDAPIIQNFIGSGTAPTINAGWMDDTSQNMITGGVLDVGDSFEIKFTITVDPDAGGSVQNLSNQATVSGQGINPDGSTMVDGSGSPVVASDESDNGIDPQGENGSEDSVDGIPDNDVTGIVIADLGVAKTTVGEPELTALGNYLVTYQIIVENTGTVDLVGLSLLEDLATQFGGAFVNAGNLTLASAPNDARSSLFVDAAAWNGSSRIEMIDAAASNLLVSGDSFTIEFEVEIDPRQVATSLGNQVEATGAGVDANGDPLIDNNGSQIIASDLSDSGADPNSSNPSDPADTGSSDDVSEFVPPPVPLGIISGVVFLDNDGNGAQDSGEGGIDGVEIILTGVDVLGNRVETTVFTDSSGRYTFDGLNAGVYSITQTQPEGFADGQENGDPAWTIGDDVMSNIELGWGQVFASSSFGERLTGASGTPPNLRGMAPISTNLLSSLINNYIQAPSPIYSGVPISSSANPLSFDSGRAVSGGYIMEAAVQWSADCDCCEPVNPCCEPTDLHFELFDACDDWVPADQVESFIGDNSDCSPLTPSDTLPSAMTDGQIMLEGESGNNCDLESEVGEQDPEAETHLGEVTPSVRAPSFLKRFASWLLRSNQNQF